MSNYKIELQSNNTDLQAILDAVNALPEASTGVELPTLTNEGTATDLLSGKQLIDQEGNIVTGTIPILTEDDITVIENVIMIPNGYFEDSKTEIDVPLAEQATPSIAVSSTGLITASVTQNAGYVRDGTIIKGTKQLTTKAATTYTPTTSNQTIASDTYLIGIQTIEGDSNLVAENIKSGVSIFGISGSYEGGSVTYTNGDEVSY